MIKTREKPEAYRCNACHETLKRDYQGKRWVKSYCTKTGKNARLYRVEKDYEFADEEAAKAAFVSLVAQLKA